MFEGIQEGLSFGFLGAFEGRIVNEIFGSHCHHRFDENTEERVDLDLFIIIIG